MASIHLTCIEAFKLYYSIQLLAANPAKRGRLDTCLVIDKTDSSPTVD